MILAEKGYLIFLTHEPDPDNAGVGMNITFMVHFVAPIYGAIFFATFMPKDWSNPFVYSIAYNAAFLLPDLAICLAVGVMIYKPMKRYIVKF